MFWFGLGFLFVFLFCFSRDGVEELCALCRPGLPEAASLKKRLLLITFLLSKLSGNYFFIFLQIIQLLKCMPKKIPKGQQTLFVSCSVLGDQETRPRAHAWGHADPGGQSWGSLRLLSQPGGFLPTESWFNYETDRDICLKMTTIFI